MRIVSSIMSPFVKSSMRRSNRGYSDNLPHKVRNSISEGYDEFIYIDSFTPPTCSVDDADEEEANVDEIFTSDIAQDSAHAKEEEANVDEIFNFDITHDSALCEWRWQNAMRLETKERTEKEKQKEIALKAEKFKRAFYERRKLNLDRYKAHNRAKEKEKLEEEASCNYWGAIVELIPRDQVPSNDDNLGKGTDLSRMRQILLKLEKTRPPHLLQPTQPPKKP